MTIKDYRDEINYAIRKIKSEKDMGNIKFYLDVIEWNTRRIEELKND